MIENGTFRKDLYYRLNTAIIQLPPLRERKEDIEAIAAEILSDLNSPCDDLSFSLSPEVLNHFLQYSWPGNIRELCNCLYYASAISTGNLITLEDLPGTVFHGDKQKPATSSLEESERTIITREVEAARFNISKAAIALGISRSTLYQKIKKHDIQIKE
jgi:transcriptional regulator with PAS, ATPase and Fis domain